MLRRLSMFLVSASVAVAAPAKAPLNPAYDRVRTDAVVSRLMESASADLKAHRLEAALAKAIQADALRPGDSAILNTKGAALVELKRFDEAKTALDASIAADSTTFAPQFNLGEMLILQKKYPEAAAHFTLLLSRFGPIARIKYNLYLSNALAGSADRARDTLAVMRYPEDGVAWYFAYAADRLMAGKKAEARDLLAAAKAIHSDEFGTYEDTLREAGLLK